MDSLKTARRPNWLKKKINLSQTQELHSLFKKLKLNTVCRQAQCPNISECFHSGVATFLILGDICTRKCRFCAVKKGRPQAVDQDEPRRVKEAVEKLGLRHVVITSVTRDDLDDKGAGLFAAVTRTLKESDEHLKVELLVPDFQGDQSAIKTVIDAGVDVFAHNIETVESLYGQVRSGACYQRSLEVLRIAKSIKTGIKTKSGIMLGLGEAREQVLEVFSDLRDAGVDFLSIGQYLSPSKEHYPVKSFVHPDEFDYYKKEALAKGFLHVESAPYVRSSYIASSYLT